MTTSFGMPIVRGGPAYGQNIVRIAGPVEITGENGNSSLPATNMNTTPVGNVGTGEDNLMTYTVPPDIFNSGLHGVRITAWGNTAANANAKSLRAYFGVLIGTTNLTANQTNMWKIVAEIVHTGPNTQRANYQLIQGGATVIVDQEENFSAVNEALPILIKITGTGVDNDDVIQNVMIVEYF